MFRFDDLSPEAKKAAFAHMDKIKGRGSIKGKLSDGKTAKPRGRATLGNGARHAKLSATRKNQPLPDAKATTKPDKPLSTEQSIGAAYKALSSKPGRFVRMTELRPLIGGSDREHVDSTLMSMLRAGDIHLSPDSDRRGLTDADHKAAIRVGREDKHLIAFEELPDVPAAQSKPSPEEISKRSLSTGYTKGEKPTESDHIVLANRYLLMHGDAGVDKKIAQLEARKRLGPGDRATLAALKSLKKK